MADRAVRPMLASDWPAVARIYREGIDTGDATFETEVPEWDEWDRGHLDVCRLVVEMDDRLVAWAALSPVSRRFVYRGVAEPSIYVATEARGRGVGTALISQLIDASEQAGIWTLQTAIFPENAGSIALHLKHGFRVVGTRQRIGAHHGRWRDVLFLERRSERAGV
jgi:L-amino acid N-acyltransferase YncA